jgi:hypothetical protein
MYVRPAIRCCTAAASLLTRRVGSNGLLWQVPEHLIKVLLRCCCCERSQHAEGGGPGFALVALHRRASLRSPPRSTSSRPWSISSRASTTMALCPPFAPSSKSTKTAIGATSRRALPSLRPPAPSRARWRPSASRPSTSPPLLSASSAATPARGTAAHRSRDHLLGCCCCNLHAEGGGPGLALALHSLLLNVEHESLDGLIEALSEAKLALSPRCPVTLEGDALKVRPLHSTVTPNRHTTPLHTAVTSAPVTLLKDAHSRCGIPHRMSNQSRPLDFQRISDPSAHCHLHLAHMRWGIRGGHPPQRWALRYALRWALRWALRYALRWARVSDALPACAQLAGIPSMGPPSDPPPSGCDTWQLAGIPEQARMFSFAHAAKLDRARISHASLSSGRKGLSSEHGHQLVLNGGFVYFDVNDNICWCNVVDHYVGDESALSNSMLQFSSPLPLPTSTQHALKASGRLKPVTLSSLVSKGAFAMAWINPGEVLEGMARPCKGGAFAYAFAKGSRALQDAIRDTDEDAFGEYFAGLGEDEHEGAFYPVVAD